MVYRAVHKPPVFRAAMTKFKINVVVEKDTTSMSALQEAAPGVERFGPW